MSGSESETTMTFLQHLEEFRQTLLRVVAAVAIGAVGCWFLSGKILTWLIANTSEQAVFLKPQGAFIARLKVAIVLGILATLPYIFYKLWSFVGPGLLDQEKRVVLPGVLGSLVLFYLGILFSYFVLTPLMVQALLTFGTANLMPQTGVQFLLDLVFAMGLACGLVFQMPLAAAFLTAIGLITPGMFRRYWRHAMVAMFVLAALLTPADLMSQLVLAVPLVILYFVSYAVASVAYHRKKRSARQEEAGQEEPDRAGP